MTVFVPGKEAGNYGFTSSLPVAILKLLAPDVEKLWLQPVDIEPDKHNTIVSKSPAHEPPHAESPKPATPNAD
jgi:hypothetical protein